MTPVLRRRLIWGGVAAALLLLVLYALRPVPVVADVEEVIVGPIEEAVEADGVARVRDRFTVSAPVTGRLTRITLREGDLLEAGAVVARITPAPLDAQAAAQARARVAAAQAGVSEATSRVAQSREVREQAALEAGRMAELAAIGAVGLQQAERAQLQLTSARSDEVAAAARLRQAQAELESARAALAGVGSETSGQGVPVRTPSAGRVLRVHEPSDRIVPAGTPLVEVGDATHLEVVTDVLSTDAVSIEPGAPVRIVEWGGEGELQGRVRLVEPSAFTRISALGVEEQRVNVVADLLGAAPRLGDGYRVEVRIVTWAGEVLRVPVSALFRSGSEWRVFVVVNGRAEQRTIGVGHRSSVAAEVTDGLSAGDRVILYPSDQIRDGARVRAR